MTSTADLALNAEVQKLREIADEDYIFARHGYPLGLRDQFLWGGLQAIEKYLKAILLYHREDPGSKLGEWAWTEKWYIKPAAILLRIRPKVWNRRWTLKRYGHDILTLCKHARRLTLIEFDLTDETKAFLRYLDRFGKNRYRTDSTFARGHELSSLDQAVWEIRVFCQNTPALIRLIERHGRTVGAPFRYSNHRGPRQLNGGLLERLLAPSVAPHLMQMAEALRYANKCYFASEPPDEDAPRMSSSFVAVCDRHWADNDEARGALERFVG